MTSLDNLAAHTSLKVCQRKELVELLGFESRNKYSIEDSSGQVVGFAAEQQKGIGGLLLRQFLGHWRRFEILLFDSNRSLKYRALHPFRFFFQELEIYSHNGEAIGRVVRRFSILQKRFDVIDQHGRVAMTVSSPIWRLWTFVFMRDGREIGKVVKRWGGLLKESFVDADSFEVSFSNDLQNAERVMLIAAAIFIDLMYFEHKAGAN